MAFKSSSSGSFHDLSSISGVPVKINDKYLPPKKVTLPMRLETSFQNHNPSEVLFMEYNFELEERVIKWSEAYRESQKAYNQVETEKVADAIEQFSRSSPGAAMLQGETEIDGNGEPGIAEKSQTNLHFPNENGDVGIMQTKAEDPKTVIQNPAVVETNPFLQAVGTDILKPMQVPTQPQKEDTDKNNKGSFDLADFEQDQDPFDTAEMRVLNDMQELKKVLQNVQEVPSAAETGSASSSNAVSSSSGSRQLVGRNPDVGVTVGKPPPYTDISQPVPAKSIKEIDYPELDSLESIKSSNSVTGTSSYGAPAGSVASSSALVVNKDMGYSHGNSYVQSNGAPYPSQINSYHNASNPFLNPAQSANSFNTTNPYGPTNSSNPFRNSTNPFAGQAVGYNKQEDSLTGALFPSSLKTVNGSANGFHEKHGQQQPTNHSSSSVGFLSHGSGYTVQLPEPSTSKPTASDTAASPGLRSCRSTPDISALANNAPVHFPTSHTPPPNPQAQKTYLESEKKKPTYTNPFADTNPWGNYPVVASPKPTAGATQWNRHPRTVALTAPSSTISTSSSSLPDPYFTMSKESQTLVNNISVMGFPRARVARSVEKLGPDDKQIIDFLCLVNRMSEQGYVADDVETALQLYENKEKKAEQYLKLLSQFRELGFTKEKVKDALVSSELDENKALDILTGNG